MPRRGRVSPCTKAARPLWAAAPGLSRRLNEGGRCKPVCYLAAAERVTRKNV
jgi:hypothetical protein